MAILLPFIFLSIGFIYKKVNLGKFQNIIYVILGFALINFVDIFTMFMQRIIVEFVYFPRFIGRSAGFFYFAILFTIALSIVIYLINKKLRKEVLLIAVSAVVLGLIIRFTGQVYDSDSSFFNYWYYKIPFIDHMYVYGFFRPYSFGTLSVVITIFSGAVFAI